TPPANCRPDRPCLARSDGVNVLGFLALLARPDLELDELALVEGAVAVHLDGRVVDEYVLSAFAGDEAVTLLRVEPLHCSCCSHAAPPLSRLLTALAPHPLAPSATRR